MLKLLALVVGLWDSGRNSNFVFDQCLSIYPVVVSQCLILNKATVCLQQLGSLFVDCVCVGMCVYNKLRPV